VCGKGRAAGAKLQTCAACGIVPYCSKACQKVDWKRGHKAACTAARAAREAAKDEGAGGASGSGGSARGKKKDKKNKKQG